MVLIKRAKLPMFWNSAVDNRIELLSPVLNGGGKTISPMSADILCDRTTVRLQRVCRAVPLTSRRTSKGVDLVWDQREIGTPLKARVIKVRARIDNSRGAHRLYIAT